MPRIEKHRWRVQWLGKWKTTRYHATEEEIRVEHPEAVKVPWSAMVIELPELSEPESTHYIAAGRPAADR